MQDCGVKNTHSELNIIYIIISCSLKTIQLDNYVLSILHQGCM